jgi:hypothetical protein
MRVKRGEQFPLPLQRAPGKGADVASLPFSIAWRKVRRAMRRQVKALDSGAAQLLPVCRLLESQALLDQIRHKARQAARQGGRKSRLRTIAYVCKPEGRRVMRVMALLSERIASQEAGLCG